MFQSLRKSLESLKNLVEANRFTSAVTFCYVNVVRHG
jgi:hypothetical protein